jgi:two-component SAPR family response regulator
MSKRNHKQDEGSDVPADLNLKGLRVFIVEDEFMVSMLIEDTLTDIGCLVAGTAARLDEAIANSASLDFDLAVIDVNLNGVRAYPLAEVLANKGVPVLFVTGYGEFGVPDNFRCIPVLSKPFQQRDLERALTKALASKAASGAAREPSPM